MTYNAIWPNIGANNGYTAIPAGEQEIKLSLGALNPDSVTIKRLVKTLEPGAYYTFMITDSINAGVTVNHQFIRDNFIKPNPGYYNLRFIHTALEDTVSGAQKTVDTVDVFSTRNNRNIYTRITPGTVTGFSQLGYNAQLNDTLYIRRTRSMVNLATLNNVQFSQQRTYTLYFKGDGNVTTGTKARSLATFVHQ
jgi:hypothetical protein